MIWFLSSDGGKQAHVCEIIRNEKEKKTASGNPIESLTSALLIASVTDDRKTAGRNKSRRHRGRTNRGVNEEEEECGANTETRWGSGRGAGRHTQRGRQRDVGPPESESRAAAWTSGDLRSDGDVGRWYGADFLHLQSLLQRQLLVGCLLLLLFILQTTKASLQVKHLGRDCEEKPHPFQAI